MKRLAALSILLCAYVGAWTCSVPAQSSPNEADLRELMREVCRFETEMLQRHDTRLRYLVQRSDRKGNTTRDQIESHDGGVARLIRHNGNTLTPAEDEGERGRLRALLGTGKVQQRERDEARNRSYGVELLRTMPDAMRFTLAAQQAPLPDVADHQLVIDFTPNPDFHPNGMAQQILTQLGGRLWVDMVDHHLLRLELHNGGEVNLAWGILAKIYPGGKILYEQRKFEDVYAFTHIAIHLRVRELLVKTSALDTDTIASDFRRVPVSPSADDAIRILLAEPVPTR